MNCPTGTVCKPGGNCEALIGPDAGVGLAGDGGGGNGLHHAGGCDLAPERRTRDNEGLVMLAALIVLAGVVLVVRRSARR